MLLNKLAVLDKGYVALISSSNDSERLKEISEEFFGLSKPNPKMLKLGTMTIAMKCPLFVHVHMAQYGLAIMNTKPSPETEAYCPNPGEVGSKDLETSRAIADDISRTTEALLINTKAYQADGCNRFLSHIIMPISTYTTILVSGTYEEWSRFTGHAGLPAPIEAYRMTVQQVLDVEWK